MAKAYVEALQSTWDKVGTDAQDQGWGKDSVIGMVKHFPGDGMGEAGRESHRNSGKYAVYPGNNMAEHYSVFESVFHLDTLTESAKAVMPSYSVAYDEDGPIGARLHRSSRNQESDPWRAHQHAFYSRYTSYGRISCDSRIPARRR